MLPLAGITVVSLEQAVAAPFATRQLADLGARVIKIERPGSGDFARGYDTTVHGLSSHFVWLNRSKESLTLNLKHPAASEIMRRLIATADIFVQNLAPGATERLGLDVQNLRQTHSRMIVCDLSGYGASGPYRNKKAYDLLIQGETGLIAVSGTAETPSKTGISTADIAGGMYAYSAILAALYHRERTGEGTGLELSLFDALSEWMGYPAYFTAYGGEQPARSGASHATIAPYGPFRTGDQQTVLLGVQNEREWDRFCTAVLGRSDLIRDARFTENRDRAAHREELRDIIEAVFQEHTAAEVIQRLEQAQIANARLNDVEQFWNHPQHSARDRWREVVTEAGPIKALIPPVSMTGVEPSMEAVPALGAHTTSILQSLGYDDPTIADLRAQKAI
ncbi:MAG: CaiB/BaiF CoA-transferase family protein [Herpetosiphon sp.]